MALTRCESGAASLRTSHTHFRVPGQEKGTSENEVPGFVGAFTQTHINTRLVVPDRARRMRMSKTNTHAPTKPRKTGKYVTHTEHEQRPPTGLSRGDLYVRRSPFSCLLLYHRRGSLNGLLSASFRSSSSALSTPIFPNKAAFFTPYRIILIAFQKTFCNSS